MNGLYYAPSSKEIVISVRDGQDKPIIFYYGFSNELDFQWVDCADNAQQVRDSLVSQGTLKPPYTNTDEYFKILKDEIRYWDGKEFISKGY